MRAEQLHLQVVTPEQAVFSEKVDSVVLPGSEGQLGVLPGHIPLLTKLDIGEMVVHQGDEERSFFVVRGFAEILGDRVRVLAEECEGVEDIDIEQARADLREAEEEVEKMEAREEDEDELLEQYRERLEKNRKRLMMSGEMDDE